MKGITFFTIDGERRLLVSERDGEELWTIDPETGEPIGDPVILHDADDIPVPGVLSLVESPDGKTLLGLRKSVDEIDNNNHFTRELVIIDPVTGLTTSLGSTGLHMADLAFALAPEGPAPQVTQVFVNGPGLTGQTSANGVAFRGLAGVDNTYGYAVPAGTAQTRSVPWNGGVNQVAIRFSQDVAATLQQGDLVVRGSTTPTYTVTGFSYDPTTKTGVWTLGSTVTNDKLRLFLDDALVTGLDGEWINTSAAESYPSGNGTAGGDFDFRINVLRGDADGNGAVNALDLSVIKQRLNKTATAPGTTGATYSPFADLDANGAINALDLSAARGRLNTRLPAPDPAATSLLFGSRPISA
jgi:hypothetical protein